MAGSNIGLCHTSFEPQLPVCLSVISRDTESRNMQRKLCAVAIMIIQSMGGCCTVQLIQLRNHSLLSPLAQAFNSRISRPILSVDLDLQALKQPSGPHARLP